MAGTGKIDDDESVISDINVTPLVDIMLCLLVIFMVTTTVVVADSIKVDLPKASTGDSTEPSTITVVYTKEGQLVLNGEKSDEAGLRAKIQQELAENKDVQAIIGADRSVTHGEVIHIIDVVKQEGIVKFALNIEQTDETLSKAAAEGTAAAKAAAGP
jgi:biopolymer transport protein ExbD